MKVLHPLFRSALRESTIDTVAKHLSSRLSAQFTNGTASAKLK
jgi:hypothetical protein